MRGVSDAPTRTQKLTGGRWWQVVLSDVRSGGTGHERQVDTIVDDDAGAVRLGGADQGVAERKERRGRQMLGADLNEWRAAVEERLRQV